MGRVAYFRDRAHGGRYLAEFLSAYHGADCVVYGLPRGGVITAVEVAKALQAPLDLLIVRKLGHPGNPEYALGAVTSEGEIVLNKPAADGVPGPYLESEIDLKLAEARTLRFKFLKDRSSVPVRGRIALIVDDGIATGSTLESAIAAVQRRKPSAVVVAAPVASSQVVTKLRPLCDAVIVPNTPDEFFAVGAHYNDFTPVEDADVLAALRYADRNAQSSGYAVGS